MVMTFVDDIGFDPVDAGGLEDSARPPPETALLEPHESGLTALRFNERNHS